MKAEKFTDQCILEPSKEPLDNSILKTKEKAKKNHIDDTIRNTKSSTC